MIRLHARARRAIRGVTALASALLSACVVGPSYRPTPVAPEAAAVGATARGDSTRTFFDSLSRARMADSGRPVRPAPKAVTMQSLADLAWLDILDDTVLTNLVRTAVSQNRDVALAQARIREYRANANAVTGALFPSVTLNGSASRNQVAFGSSPVKFDALRVTGDVAWEIDFWGRSRRGLEAVNADLAAQQAAERAAVLSLVSDVASGYLQLLELDQEYDVAQRTLATRQTTLDLARQRFNQGIVSELDVRQFEAQLAVPAERLAQVERLRAQQEHALNLLLGEGPAPIARGTSLVAASRAVSVPDSLPASLIVRRPDVVQADRAVAGAVARVGIAEAARLPVVSLGGYFGSQSAAGNRLFATGTNVYQMQAGISFPLYTGGRLKNQELAARARVDQAQAAYEKTAYAALREAGDALVGVRTTRDEVAATETQAGALRRAADLALLRYQTGISSYLEVLDAQRSLFDAELALSAARLRELTAAVQLYKALGGSWTP